MATGFGRRIVGSRVHELVVIDGDGDNAAPVDPAIPSAVKEQIRAVLMSRIDPAAAGRLPRTTLKNEIAKLVEEIATEERIELNESEGNILATELADDMIGLGPLEPFLDDDEITDILVNGPYNIYIERRGKLEKTTGRFRDVQHVVNVAQRIASAVGRRIDESSPMVDARLADGSRVHLALAPIVLNGGTMSIRKFRKQGLTIDAMVRQGNLSEPMARFLEIATHVRANILISGGTGSGKTTLLNAISRAIDTNQRIVSIEDAVELRLQQPHVVQMETRAANIEGVGEIPQRELVRNALRMRPDRIIVGEVRGAEAFDMLQAMNTGHEGSMSTIHANTPRDALYRLENMVLMAAVNLPLRAIRAQIASAINLIVQVERMRDGIRRIERIVELSGMEGEIITARDLFTFRYSGESREGIIQGNFESTRLRPDLAARAVPYGLEKAVLDAVGISDGPARAAQPGSQSA
jgi:pilus assembly protein CpaF